MRKGAHDKRGGVKMKSCTSLIAILLIPAVFFISPGGSSTVDNWGTAGTHDAGNFTISIGDDGGDTTWNILEYPVGQDRLNTAYFGLGYNSSTVAFGDFHSWETVDQLLINRPGNYTDEEGFCRFKGYNGGGLDFINVTQRTFVNNYTQDTAGHTGRWLVVDYLIESALAVSGPLYTMQTMDLNLGDPSNDEFAWDGENRILCTKEGTTYIGLTYYQMAGPDYHGHNAGLWNPSVVYDSEETIFDSMGAPNNQTTSATQQNWYMDMVAKVPPGSFPGSARVSFAILVGNSMDQLVEAKEDAVTALRGAWSSDPPSGWNSGDVEVSAIYDGPLLPLTDITPSHTLVGGGGEPIHPEPTPMVDGSVSFTIDSAYASPDHGTIDYWMGSRNPWGYMDNSPRWGIDCDNSGPDITFTNNSPTATVLQVDAEPDDRGGSGTDLVYMSLDGGEFLMRSTLTTEEESKNHTVSAYAVDYAGNRGPTVNLYDLMVDGSPPVIGEIGFEPSNITEDTSGPVGFSLTISDAISGVNLSSAEFSHGLDHASSEWVPLDHDGGLFTGQVEYDWNSYYSLNVVVEVRVKDKVGNDRVRSFEEYVDPINDPPTASMEVISGEWENHRIYLKFTGGDPDGDQLEFSVECSTDGVNFESYDLNNWDSPGHSFWVAPGKTPYEGPFHIRGWVTDAEGTYLVGTEMTTVDTLAPRIEYTGEVPLGWTDNTTIGGITATETGSGVDARLFEGTSGDKRETFTQGHSRDFEGIWDIRAYARDRAMNERYLDIGTFRWDLSPPSLWNLLITPGDHVVGNGLTVSFNFADNLSGLDRNRTLVRVSGEQGVVGPDELDHEGTLTEAYFSDPFTKEGVYNITISIQDILGHTTSIRREVRVDRAPVVLPFSISCPESVGTGEEFEVLVEYEHEVRLDAVYPKTVHPWRIPPKRTEGDKRTFSLPGAYAGPIVLKFSYPPEDPLNSTWGEYVLEIAVKGASDADGDGLEDSWERKYGLDPGIYNDPSGDGDEDGLDLLAEMYNLTDPGKYDSDGDEMDDGWEAKMGTRPFDYDAWEDTDGDDWSNLKEYVEGTDPLDPEDHPEKPPPTAWYWIVLIFLVLLSIIGYFAYQMFRKRELEDDLDSFEKVEDWEGDRTG